MIRYVSIASFLRLSRFFNVQYLTIGSNCGELIARNAGWDATIDGD